MQKSNTCARRSDENELNFLLRYRSKSWIMNKKWPLDRLSLLIFSLKMIVLNVRDEENEKKRKMARGRPGKSFLAINKRWQCLRSSLSRCFSFSSSIVQSSFLRFHLRIRFHLLSLLFLFDCFSALHTVRFHRRWHEHRCTLLF